MVATASENGLKVAVFLASCLATTAQTQEASRTPKTNVMPRRHPQFQTSHKHASTKKPMHKPRHPGQQIAEPRCRRLVTCCSPGSLLTELKLFAEVLDLPMTHAATDPRGFTASRRRALSSSASALSAVIFDGGHGLRKWIKGCCRLRQLPCNDHPGSRSHPGHQNTRHSAKTSATELQQYIYQEAYAQTTPPGAANR